MQFLWRCIREWPYSHIEAVSAQITNGRATPRQKLETSRYFLVRMYFGGMMINCDVLKNIDLYNALPLQP